MQSRGNYCNIGTVREGELGSRLFNVKHDDLLYAVRFRHRQREETKWTASARQTNMSAQSSRTIKLGSNLDLTE